MALCMPPLLLTSGFSGRGELRENASSCPMPPSSAASRSVRTQLLRERLLMPDIDRPGGRPLRGWVLPTRSQRQEADEPAAA